MCVRACAHMDVVGILLPSWQPPPPPPRVKMLSSPTTDSGKLLAILHGLVPGGANHFTNGIKVAMVSAWAVE